MWVPALDLHLLIYFVGFLANLLGFIVKGLLIPDSLTFFSPPGAGGL